MKFLAAKLLNIFLVRVVAKRKPDVVIGGEEKPYMLRWWLIPRNRFFNLYLHHFRRSDDDHALHDHPWCNVSLLLEGTYTEHTIAKGGVHRKHRFEAGALKFRWATYAHRIELTDGFCWSLFITGPKIREWFFHCTRGLVHWRDYTKTDRPGEIGVGCGEE